MRKKTKKLIIKPEDINVSIGHQKHFTGTGAWDNRPKRQRTRSAQSRASYEGVPINGYCNSERPVRRLSSPSRVSLVRSKRSE